MSVKSSPNSKDPLQSSILHSAVLPALLSGAVQAALFNPYDRALYVRVKYRRRKFLDWRNFDRPFQGFLNASFYRTTVSGGYFLWQDTVRIVIERFFPSQFHGGASPQFNAALIGLLAGALNGFLLNPLQIVKFRMWNSGSSAAAMNFWQTARQLFREGGCHIFFRGCLTTVIRDCVFGVTYESVRRMNYGDMFFSSPTDKEAEEQHSGRYDKASLFSNMSAALCASILSSPFNFVRSVVYSTAPGATPVNAIFLYRALANQLKFVYRYGDSYVHRASIAPGDRIKHLARSCGAQRRCYPKETWGWFNSRLNIGWGSLRIGLGMGMSQNLFYFFQKSFA